MENAFVAFVILAVQRNCRDIIFQKFFSSADKQECLLHMVEYNDTVITSVITVMMKSNV